MYAVANTAIFKIIDAKMYVPVVTLSTEDNARFSKLLSEGFNRSIYWNEYKVIDSRIVEIAAANREGHIRELLDSSYQGVKRLFVLADDNTAGDNQVPVDSSKNIYFQEFKLKITTLQLMEEIFMIIQLITRLSNTTKSEKYQQDRVMITRLVVCWILLIFKKNKDKLQLI